MQRNLLTLLTVSLLALNGCATQQSSSAKEDRLSVIYSKKFSNETELKSVPEEVMIVRPEQAQKMVAAQVGLGIFSAVFGGGVGFQSFSKDNLKGEKIEDVKAAGNISNPIASGFIKQLQEDASGWLQGNPAMVQRSFKNPVTVAGGRAALVYAELTGQAAGDYKMKIELEIYKRKEDAGMFSISPFHKISCDRSSERAYPLDVWAKSDYVMVRQWMDETLQQCRQKFLEALPSIVQG